MTKTPQIPVRRAFAASAVQRPLHALQGRIAGVRRAEDVEAVHKMRVASRRLRNAMDLFFDELPADVRPKWLKRIRAVTRALGTARDLDVQIEFLRGFQAAEVRLAERDGVARLVSDFEARRRRIQKSVLRAMDRLETDSTLDEIANWAQSWSPAKPRARWTDANLRAEAEQSIGARLADMLAYEPYVERAECVAELHAMRIAAKRLRYTLEVYGPLFAQGLKPHIAWARGFQDVLGALHDCDVWLAELPKLRARPRRRNPHPAEGIAALLADRRAVRDRLYAQFVANWRRTGGTRARQHFRRTLGKTTPPSTSVASRDVNPARSSRRSGTRAAVPFDPAGDARWAPALALARECAYEAAHSHQVTGLALRLFDELAAAAGLNSQHRVYLANAGILHDIGWIKGRASHHKTALRLIEESSDLPWKPRTRAIVGAVARYHRGALPRLDHDCFGSLPRGDRTTVRKLAALLRLADGLDYTHQGLVRDVQCHVHEHQIEIDCIVRAPAPEEIAHARTKSDLMRQVFNREIEVKWRLPEPNSNNRS